MFIMSLITFSDVVSLQLIVLSSYHSIYRKKAYNSLKFSPIMNTDEIDILSKLAIFYRKVVQHFDRIHK